MRRRILRLLSTLSCLLAACGSSGLPLPDGGGGSPDGGGTTDLANAVADLAMVRCVGLDEATCRATKGCAADTCMECSCTPTFVGCRAASAPPVECPALGCLQPLCCHSNADCPMGALFCIAPGASPGGGPCFMPTPCKVDGDCAQQGPTWICAIATSACGPAAMGCVPGCSRDMDCPEGDVCRNDHHCVARPCMSAHDCPAEFACVGGGCARLACNSDGDCGAGYCVEGACYTSLGVCEPPAP